MRGLGEGVAFAAMCASAVYLEVNGYKASGLWVLLVIWAACSRWGKEEEK